MCRVHWSVSARNWESRIVADAERLLRELAEHRAAQVPAASPAFANPRSISRLRRGVIAAVAATVVVLIVDAVLVFGGKEPRHSRVGVVVPNSAPPPPSAVPETTTTTTASTSPDPAAPRLAWIQKLSTEGGLNE